MYLFSNHLNFYFFSNSYVGGELSAVTNVCGKGREPTPSLVNAYERKRRKNEKLAETNELVQSVRTFLKMFTKSLDNRLVIEYFLRRVAAYNLKLSN